MKYNTEWKRHIRFHFILVKVTAGGHVFIDIGLISLTMRESAQIISKQSHPGYDITPTCHYRAWIWSPSTGNGSCLLVDAHPYLKSIENLSEFWYYQMNFHGASNGGLTLEIRLRGKLLIWYQYYAAVGHGEFESVRLISKWSVLHLHRKDSKENDIQTTCSINLLPVVQEASPWYSFASFFPFAFSSSPHFLSPKRAPNLNCITPLLLPSKG